MDMFPDTALVREIQRQLDDIIQQGVQNITRLIRATDPSGTVPGGGAPPKALREERGLGQGMSNSLAGRLVRDGLLTPDLLRQLQKEWSTDQKQDRGTHSANAHSNTKGKKKKKK